MYGKPNLDRVPTDWSDMRLLARELDLHAEEFILTDDHLTLLGEAQVGWGQAEFTAPEIDQKRPYGNSSVEGDLEEHLPHLSEGQRLRVHAETLLALQVVLATRGFATGRYTKKNQYDPQSWALAEAAAQR